LEKGGKGPEMSNENLEVPLEYTLSIAERGMNQNRQEIWEKPKENSLV